MAKKTSGRKIGKKKAGEKIDRYGPVKTETVKEVADALASLQSRAELLHEGLVREKIELVEGVDGYKAHERGLDILRGFIGDVAKKAQRRKPTNGAA